MVRSGRRRSTSAISAPAKPMTMTHSSMEPSWLPKLPDSLKINGFIECEFDATNFTDKSVIANSQTSMANDRVTSTPCMMAAGRISPASSPLPSSRTAMKPAIICNAASAAASHRAARPSSAIIRGLRWFPRPFWPPDAVPFPAIRAGRNSRHAWRGDCPRQMYRRNPGAPRPLRPNLRRTGRARSR